MKRPINICSGQFGDLTLEELCKTMHEIGYNGIEIATQAHLDVRRVLTDAAYRDQIDETLNKYDMHIGAISAHLIGQCVGDNWDPRLDNFAPAHCKGNPEAIRAWAIEEKKNGRYQIVITEIPYMVNKARMIESIADLVKEKRIEGISDLNDESNRHGMRVVVELKKEANPQVVLNNLYRYTQLQDTVGVILLALDNGVPKIMTLKTMLQRYVEFQDQVIRRRTQFDLKKARERAHILEGLKRAVDIVDEVIYAIRHCGGGQAEAKAAIMEQFGFDDVQADAICKFPLGRLAGLEIKKIENELSDLSGKIADWTAILDDDSRVLAIVKNELTALKEKFGDDRRTEIAHVSGEVDIEDLIPVEDCVVTLTHFGYVKRQPADVYKTQRRGGRGISGMTRREEDVVEDLFVSSSHDYLCFFTNRGRLFRLKCYEIPESSRTGRGTNIVNLLPLEQEEKVSAVLKVSDFADDRFLVMVTKKGIIKRTELSAYRNVRKSGLIAIHLDEEDELAWVRETSGANELLIATRNGMAIRFNETDARPLGRTARGVKSIQLEDGDEVVGMARVKEGATLMTITENGAGRRTSFDQYRLQSRGGKGIRHPARRGCQAAAHPRGRGRSRSPADRPEGTGRCHPHDQRGESQPQLSGPAQYGGHGEGR